MRFLACRPYAYLGSGEVPVRPGGDGRANRHVTSPSRPADLPITLGHRAATASGGASGRRWASLRFAEFGPRYNETSSGVSTGPRRLSADTVDYAGGSGAPSWLSTLRQGSRAAGPSNRNGRGTLDEALIERGAFLRTHRVKTDLDPARSDLASRSMAKPGAAQGRSPRNSEASENAARNH